MMMTAKTYTIQSIYPTPDRILIRLEGIDEAIVLSPSAIEGSKITGIVFRKNKRLWIVSDTPGNLEEAKQSEAKWLAKDIIKAG